jgi:hypothetical protein
MAVGTIPLYIEEIVTDANAQSAVPDLVGNSYSPPTAAHINVKGSRHFFRPPVSYI